MFKKAKVVMLSTNQKAQDSNALIWKEHWEEGELFYAGNCPASVREERFRDCASQHLYILSDDKIEEGDYIVDVQNRIGIALGNQDHQHMIKYADGTYTMFRNEILKVIATTDPKLNLPSPSKAFIQKYCDLGGVDEVMVEYLEVNKHGINCLKVSPDNTITIKKVKTSFTYEDIVHAFRSGHNAKANGMAHADAWVEYRNKL